MPRETSNGPGSYRCIGRMGGFGERLQIFSNPLGEILLNRAAAITGCSATQCRLAWELRQLSTRSFMKTQSGFYRSVVASVLLAGPAAFGGTLATYSGANGNWNVAANWTPAVVPVDGGGTVYDVAIPSGKTVAYNVAGTNAIN